MNPAAMNSEVQKRGLRQRFSGIVLLGYWVALFIATHIPLTRMPLPGQSDKSAHFLAYAGLAILFCWWSLHGERKWWSVFLILAAYAVVDELLQYPVNRHPDVWDALADWVGVLAGIAVFALLRGWNKRHDAA